MEKNTYGAPRLVDWVAQIKAGGATVRVHFTGGALTAYGVTPAEYTTDNPFIQKVIEQSTYFKEGRIILLRKTELPDPVKPTKAQRPKQVEPNGKPAEPGTAPAAPVKSDIKAAEQPTEANAKTADNSTIVEVSCLQDAQAYLQENYNISSYKVRSYEAAQRAASEHGVRFAGAKFDAINGSEEAENATMGEGE